MTPPPPPSPRRHRPGVSVSAPVRGVFAPAARDWSWDFARARHGRCGARASVAGPRGARRSGWCGVCSLLGRGAGEESLPSIMCVSSWTYRRDQSLVGGVIPLVLHLSSWPAVWQSPSRQHRPSQQSPTTHRYPTCQTPNSYQDSDFSTAESPTQPLAFFSLFYTALLHPSEAIEETVPRHDLNTPSSLPAPPRQHPRARVSYCCPRGRVVAVPRRQGKSWAARACDVWVSMLASRSRPAERGRVVCSVNTCPCFE